MYIVTVEFEVRPELLSAFLASVEQQARVSLTREPLCYRFDVCRPHGEENTVFLYEVYRDAEAFQLHLETPHFADFDSKTRGMIHKKSVRTMKMIGNNEHE